MIKITRFTLGTKKQYRGFSIKIGWFKFERIYMSNKFLWRLELSYGWNK